MGILCKPYEISVWEDIWDQQTKQIVEKKSLIIGSDLMEYQGRALEPNLIRKTNGEINFSFKMYSNFIDTSTGEKTDNLFVSYIKNETKIKLKYGEEWFDLLVKNIAEDSTTKSYTYQLVDQHMTELSKNGFNLELDSNLTNNSGTVKQLGEKILADTDWHVDSEKIVRTQEEPLVCLRVTQPGGITAHLIVDDDLINFGAVADMQTALIPQDAVVYGFYSSCSGDQPYRFQFIYNPSGDFMVTSGKIITNTNCQYFMDAIYDWQSAEGLTIPQQFALEKKPSGEYIFELRGARYVYTQITEYHTGLKMYLQKYIDPSTNKEYYKYVNTSYITPNVVKNLVTNEEFKSTAGWEGAKFNGANFNTGSIAGAKLGPSPSICSQQLAEDYFVIGKTIGFKNTTQIKEEYFYLQNFQIEEKQIYPVFKTDSTASVLQGVFLGFFSEDPSNGVSVHLNSPDLTPKISNVSLRIGDPFGTSSDTIIHATEDMINGEYKNNISTYSNYIQCEDLSSLNLGTNRGNVVNRVIRNSGPNDFKQYLNEVSIDDDYILKFDYYICKQNTETKEENLIEHSDFAKFKIWVADPKFDNNLYGYNELDFNPGSALFECEGILNNNTHINSKLFSSTIELKAGQTLSAQQLQDSNYQIFIHFNNFSPDVLQLTNNGSLEIVESYRYIVLIKKLQLFKKCLKSNGDYISPDEEAIMENTTYVVEDKFFSVDDYKNSNYAQINFVRNNGFKPLLSTNAEKVDMVNIKESNYFNAIQQTAETFKCWPKIEVNHDSEGNITNFPGENYSKRIFFKNYIGQPNCAGFRYGVNSKAIKRTIDSKQIVSKLIVKNNSNQFGQNGFCTIARADSNIIKDNVLYDFDYYVNIGQLEGDFIEKDLYYSEQKEIDDLNTLLSLKTKITDTELSKFLNSCSGYYVKMRIINMHLETLVQQISQYSTPLNTAIADYNTSKAQFEAAAEELKAAQERFYKTAGFPYDDTTKLKEAEVEQSETLLPLLQEISEFIYAEEFGKKKLEVATQDKEFYETSLSNINLQYDNGLLVKNQLNKLFYSRYSRFIQEGTWIDESYMDDNLYYTDAILVLHNSSKPQVSYTIDTLSLQGVEGYELFDFKIGDQTFVEDTEFFGFEEDGITPYREAITITETSEFLESPEKTVIKVQNYENQFQDLFQRITATVQSVQYTQGAYQKAVSLAEADVNYKINYLANAITNPSMTLSNSGAQNWTLDQNGLILTSRVTQESIKISGEGISFGKNDNTGTKVWSPVITPNGIKTDYLKSGIIDTNEIMITNGKDTTFRWDSHGLTAYLFEEQNGAITKVKKTQGIRFDKFGIYGYNGVNGETWKPTGISTGTDPISKKATFYLTWEGLKVEGPKGATLQIGSPSTGDSLLLIKNEQGNTTFSITSDGTVTWKDPAAQNVSINRSAILEALKDGDGIYEEGGYIAINATLIKSGYLRFSDPENPNAVYYIDPFLEYETGGHYLKLPGFTLGKSGMNATQGTIGGWKIDGTKIISTEGVYGFHTGYRAPNPSNQNLGAIGKYGYLFTALYPAGLRYEIYEEEDTSKEPLETFIVLLSSKYDSTP